MTRIFRYVLMNDTGMAPCIDNGRVSLATCKPKIRSSAKPGDWVIGCRPSPDQCEVVWAGRVAQSIEVGEFERQYRGRSDAIYRGKPNAYERLRPAYHPGADELRKDTSAPALVFAQDETWYFGRTPQRLPEHLMHLAAGGRGHRVGGVRVGDIDELVKWLKGVAKPGVHARPRDAAPQKTCGGC